MFFTRMFDCSALSIAINVGGVPQHNSLQGQRLIVVVVVCHYVSRAAALQIQQRHHCHVVVVCCLSHCTSSCCSAGTTVMSMSCCCSFCLSHCTSTCCSADTTATSWSCCYSCWLSLCTSSCSSAGNVQSLLFWEVDSQNSKLSISFWSSMSLSHMATRAFRAGGFQLKYGFFKLSLTKSARGCPSCLIPVVIDFNFLRWLLALAFRGTPSQIIILKFILNLDVSFNGHPFYF